MSETGQRVHNRRIHCSMSIVLVLWYYLYYDNMLDVCNKFKRSTSSVNLKGLKDDISYYVKLQYTKIEGNWSRSTKESERESTRTLKTFHD